MTPRIGFCCKYISHDAEVNEGIVEADMNQSSTTLTALRKLDSTQQIDKLFLLVQKNCTVLWNQLNYLAKLPLERRLFRITSDFLPAYTAVEFSHIYSESSILKYLIDTLGPVRTFADTNGIRLCSHPGQFTVLSSQKSNVVDASIADLEYHACLAEMMGYGDSWHSSGFVINIHANNNIDPGLIQFSNVFKNRLSKVLQNLLTIENDEFSCTVDQLIASGIGEHIALVLDIHHHWIATKGQYIQHDDPRLEYYRNSWRGHRPLGHFSTSQQDLVIPHEPDIKVLPDYTTLVSAGLNSRDLRKHSDNCWNIAANSWAISHLSWTDIEVEAKAKNLASYTLYNQAIIEGAITP